MPRPLYEHTQAGWPIRIAFAAASVMLIVLAAMPAAVFPIVLARHYGGHPPTAIQVVVATGAVSLLSIPAVVAWGARWVFGG